jgi:hypothetical protein
VARLVKIFATFIARNGLFLCTQQPTTGPPFKFHFNNISWYIHRFPKLPHPFRFPDYNFVGICDSSHACYLFRPSHRYWLHQLVITGRYFIAVRMNTFYFAATNQTLITVSARTEFLQRGIQRPVLFMCKLCIMQMAPPPPPIPNPLWLHENRVRAVRSILIFWFELI